jgi:ankyrin repeat protein
MIGNIKKVGNDLLFHAITHANVHDVIALLEENEVDVNCTNINGHTPLHVRSTLLFIMTLLIF